MIAATSIALGLIAVQLRSAVAYAIISTVILFTFGAAVLVSAGSIQWLLLLHSVVFFNLGIAADVIFLTVVEVVRRRQRARERG